MSDTYHVVNYGRNIPVFSIIVKARLKLNGLLGFYSIFATLTIFPELYIFILSKRPLRREKGGMWQDQSRANIQIVHLSACLRCDKLYTSCKCCLDTGWAIDKS